MSCLLFCCSCQALKPRLESFKHDLVFSKLADSWDEGIPLGNGMLGALVWKKGDSLRISLDRADLWDVRPIQEFHRPEFSFRWVQRQVENQDYTPVQRLFDLPFERDPAPTRIPAGALIFVLPGVQETDTVRLYLKDAVCTVAWKGGRRLELFVHASKPVGWFRLAGFNQQVKPEIEPPPYGFQSDTEMDANSVSGQDLRRLGYPPPQVHREGNEIHYHQKGWGNFSYEVAVRWRRADEQTLVGAWSIGTSGSPYSKGNPHDEVRRALRRSFEEDLKTHLDWWKRYWSRSSVSLPDSVLESQWFREIYKFGAASRRGAPPISLQAVWTADNGRIPPWKGDFHHDLNTQLSYWPCYASNHLEEGLSYLDWLWSIRPAAYDYTYQYFGTAGLNVPGVTTLLGEPMGGWIQYSLGPTVSAWLAQHFYLHWRYSMDRSFLKKRAYPWLRDVAVHLDELTERDEKGLRRLPLSSSPEINDNRISAWFRETTNFDLALIHWTYRKAAELAGELGKKTEAARWRAILEEWPELAFSADDGRLLVAPEYPLPFSHRHFSHLMAIHPLGIVDWDNGGPDRRIIRASLDELGRMGTDWWVGYSYSWLGAMKARARDGEGAAGALRIFAECFCLPNSFHVNGDQSGRGKSRLTYRPFTLEGNFAFAAALQEMLIQSHSGVVHLFPAVPVSWQSASFRGLRSEGAFIVSAVMDSGVVSRVHIYSERGGLLRLSDPFGSRGYRVTGVRPDCMEEKEGILFIELAAGEDIMILSGRTPAP